MLIILFFFLQVLHAAAQPHLSHGQEAKHKHSSHRHTAGGQGWYEGVGRQKEREGFAVGRHEKEGFTGDGRVWNEQGTWCAAPECDYWKEGGVGRGEGLQFSDDSHKGGVQGEGQQCFSGLEGGHNGKEYSGGTVMHGSQHSGAMHSHSSAAMHGNGTAALLNGGVGLQGSLIQGSLAGEESFGHGGVNVSVNRSKAGTAGEYMSAGGGGDARDRDPRVNGSSILISPSSSGSSRGSIRSVWEGSTGRQHKLLVWCREQAAGLTEGFALIAASSYLTLLCAYLLMTYIVGSLMYFQRSLVVASMVTAANERTEFFATVYSFSAVVICVMQVRCVLLH